MDCAISQPLRLSDEEFTEKLVGWKCFIYKRGIQLGFTEYWQREDYVSEVNFIAWKYRRRYDANRGSFGNWLNFHCRSAASLIRKRMQKRKALPSTKSIAVYSAQRGLIDVEDRRSDRIDSLEIAAVLRPLIDALTPTQAHVINGYLAGKRQVDMAAECGVSRQAIQQRSAHAAASIFRLAGRKSFPDLRSSVECETEGILS